MSQSPKRSVAFQGHEGAYSHLSCRKVFPDLPTQACLTFSDAMDLVEVGDVDIAMIPVENSTAGRVEEIYRQRLEAKSCRQYINEIETIRSQEEVGHYRHQRKAEHGEAEHRDKLRAGQVLAAEH